MSLELCILASGSSGNCSVLRTPNGVLLIDAGIGPRTAAKRLLGTGVAVADISAICLTHLDHDHFSRTWIQTLVARGIKLLCHGDRVPDLMYAAKDALPSDGTALAAFERALIPFKSDGEFEAFAGLRVRPLPLAHDREGSHGFVMDGWNCRLGYATDLGRVPDSLIDAFDDLDLLAIESNYDPEMQMNSARPWFLKQRIMGGAGHLSNGQALWAVRTILDRDEKRGARGPQHVVLLHRSRQCNCPKVIRQLFSSDPRLADRLTIAEQYEPTPWLRVERQGERIKRLVGEQLALSWT